MSKLYTGIELLEAYYNGEINKNTKLKDYNKECQLIDVKSSVISALSYYRATELLNHTFELIEDEVDIDNIEDLLEIKEYEVDKTDVVINRNKINELVQAVKQLNKEIKSIKEK